MIGCHDVAHRTNLAAKALTELPLFESVEILLRKTHNYFSHSPKRHLEFVKLAEVMETKGLRLLKNVQTRWVSLLEPLRRFLAQYRVVMAKMAEDIDDNSDAQVSFFNFFIYFYLIFVYFSSLYRICSFILKSGSVGVLCAGELGRTLGPLHIVGHDSTSTLAGDCQHTC